MPNWCEGNIRFRGKKKDIKRFLMNEIVSCRYDKNHETVEEEPTFKDEDWCLTITKPDDAWFYIKGTHRNFFEQDVLEVWMEADTPDEEIIVCIEKFKAAWSFERCDKWKEHAKEYSLDVKMVGYDRGMMFSQIKVITKDGMIKDIVHEYEDGNDWMWNCPQPNNGG